MAESKPPSIIVLHCTEDGPAISKTTEAEFLRDLADGDYGENPEFDTELPVDLNAYVGLVVIRGDIITPQPVLQVTKYKLPK